jgi:hypothetical protein
MANPVAPGESGYNLLSKRYTFRVVILNGLLGDDDKPIEGPMVLESKDGSYKHELEISEAIKSGGHLIFEFQVRLRDKEYFCYIKDASRKFKWDLLPVGMVEFDKISEKEGDQDAQRADA